MKHQAGSVFPLVIIIVLLILSLVMVHKNKESCEPFQINTKYSISADLKNYFLELIHSGDYDKTAQLVDRFHFVKKVQFVRFLLYDAVIKLSHEEKMKAFLKILMTSARKDYQKALLNEFDLKKFQCQKPFLGLVVTYAGSLLPLVLQWLSLNYEAEHIIALGSHAYEYAVSVNDVNACGLLLEYDVEIDPKNATNLLLDVIYHKKNKAFIPLLVQLGANLQKNIISKKLLLYKLQKNNLL